MAKLKVRKGSGTKGGPPDMEPILPPGETFNLDDLLEGAVEGDSPEMPPLGLSPEDIRRAVEEGDEGIKGSGEATKDLLAEVMASLDERFRTVGAAFLRQETVIGERLGRTEGVVERLSATLDSLVAEVKALVDSITTMTNESMPQQTETGVSEDDLEPGFKRKAPTHTRTDGNSLQNLKAILVQVPTGRRFPPESVDQLVTRVANAAMVTPDYVKAFLNESGWILPDGSLLKT